MKKGETLGDIKKKKKKKRKGKDEDDDSEDDDSKVVEFKVDPAQRRERIYKMIEDGKLIRKLQEARLWSMSRPEARTKTEQPLPKVMSTEEIRERLLQAMEVFVVRKERATSTRDFRSKVSVTFTRRLKSGGSVLVTDARQAGQEYPKCVEHVLVELDYFCPKLPADIDAGLTESTSIPTPQPPLSVTIGTLTLTDTSWLKRPRCTIRGLKSPAPHWTCFSPFHMLREPFLLRREIKRVGFLPYLRMLGTRQEERASWSAPSDSWGSVTSERMETSLASERTSLAEEIPEEELGALGPRTQSGCIEDKKDKSEDENDVDEDKTDEGEDEKAECKAGKKVGKDKMKEAKGGKKVSKDKIKGAKDGKTVGKGGKKEGEHGKGAGKDDKKDAKVAIPMVTVKLGKTSGLSKNPTLKTSQELAFRVRQRPQTKTRKKVHVHLTTPSETREDEDEAGKHKGGGSVNTYGKAKKVHVHLNTPSETREENAKAEAEAEKNKGGESVNAYDKAEKCQWTIEDPRGLEDTDLPDDVDEDTLFELMGFQEIFNPTKLKSSYSFEKMFARHRGKPKYNKLLKNYRKPYIAEAPDSDSDDDDDDDDDDEKMEKDWKRKSTMKTDGKRKSTMKTDGKRKSTMKTDGKRKSTMKTDEKRKSTMKTDEKRKSTMKTDGKRKSTMKTDGKRKSTMKTDGEKRSTMKASAEKISSPDKIRKKKYIVDHTRSAADYDESNKRGGYPASSKKGSPVLAKRGTKDFARMSNLLDAAMFETARRAHATHALRKPHLHVGWNVKIPDGEEAGEIQNIEDTCWYKATSTFGYQLPSTVLVEQVAVKDNAERKKPKERVEALKKGKGTGDLLENMLAALYLLERDHDVISYITIAFIDNPHPRLPCVKNVAADQVEISLPKIKCNIRGTKRPPPHEDERVRYHMVREPFWVRRRKELSAFPNAKLPPLPGPSTMGFPAQERPTGPGERAKPDASEPVRGEETYLGPRDGEGTELVGEDPFLYLVPGLTRPADDVKKGDKAPKADTPKKGKGKGKKKGEEDSSDDDEAEEKIKCKLDPVRKQQVQEDLKSMSREWRIDKPPAMKKVSAKTKLKQGLRRKRAAAMSEDDSSDLSLSGSESKDDIASLPEADMNCAQIRRWDKCPTFSEFYDYLLEEEKNSPKQKGKEQTGNWLDALFGPLQILPKGSRGKSLFQIKPTQIKGTPSAESTPQKQEPKKPPTEEVEKRKSKTKETAEEEADTKPKKAAGSLTGDELAAANSIGKKLGKERKSETEPEHAHTRKVKAEKEKELKTQLQIRVDRKSRATTYVPPEEIRRKSTLGVTYSGTRTLTAEQLDMVNKAGLILSVEDPWHISVRFAYLAGGVCDSIGVRSALLRRREQIYKMIDAGKLILKLNEARLWSLTRPVPPSRRGERALTLPAINVTGLGMISEERRSTSKDISPDTKQGARKKTRAVTTESETEDVKGRTTKKQKDDKDKEKKAGLKGKEKPGKDTNAKAKDTKSKDAKDTKSKDTKDTKSKDTKDTKAKDTKDTNGKDQKTADEKKGKDKKTQEEKGGEALDDDIPADINEADLFELMGFDKIFEPTKLKSSYSFEKMFAHRPKAIKNYDALLKQFQKPYAGKKKKTTGTPPKQKSPPARTPPKTPPSREGNPVEELKEEEGETVETARQEVTVPTPPPMIVGKLRDYRFLKYRDHVPAPLAGLCAGGSMNAMSVEDMRDRLLQAMKVGFRGEEGAGDHHAAVSKQGQRDLHQASRGY
nr:hypothetical protein BaRGS_024555 [Batillaria attramentaria]